MFRRAGVFCALTFLASAPAAPAQETYIYDALGQVSGVARVTGGTNTLSGYRYDAARNRTNSHALPVSARAAQNVMQGGDMLLPLDELKSLDGRFTLRLETSGELFLYHYATPIWQAPQPWWADEMPQAIVLSFQGDGNLVLYNPNWDAVWGTDTWDMWGAELVLQNDGNLVMYRNGSSIWATNTCCY